MSINSEVALRRFLLCLGCLIFLKICETWILSPHLDQLSQGFTPIRRPHVNHPRCDACIAIASRLDKALRSADSRWDDGGEELNEEEVEEIVSLVCRPGAFSHVSLVKGENNLRLACPHLETWGWRHDTAVDGKEVNWPSRVANHCRYLADRLKGIEMYDHWLRSGHQDPAEWAEFLCEGEGVFGDCIDHIEWNQWPAADGEEKVTLMDQANNPDNVVLSRPHLL